MYQFPLFPGLSAPGIEAPPPAPAPDQLFTEARIGALVLRNRVLMAAMGTGFATPDGKPSRRVIAWYAARAAGGTGMVIVESTLVGGPPAPRPRLRLDSDGAISGFRRLARVIHAGGARAAVQLNYAPVQDLRSLGRGDLTRIAIAFGDAAQRARSAGFDAVEIQASHRSLLAHTLSGAENRRTDRYGGSVARRTRLLVEVIAAVKRGAGADLPVLVKFSADERRLKGVTPEEAQEIAQILETAGADALEIIAGSSASEAPIRLSAGTGEATQAELAQAVKHAVTIPVVAAGRILIGDTAEIVLRKRQADLVAVGRALFTDPAWASKIRLEIETEVAPCIACMACYTPGPDGGTGCPVAAEAGREYLPPLQATTTPRRITVLGASLAGLELARVAAARGHDVQIVPAGLPLGGLLGLRAGVPGNAEFGRSFLYFGDRLAELGVPIVDAPEHEFDLIVDCRPGAEVRPAWATGRGVMLAAELLGRDLHELYGIGRRVAVVGPGALAAEVALFLAGWGRRPTVLTPHPGDNPFPDIHPMHAARLLERLEGYKVPIEAGVEALGWTYDEDRKSALRVRRGGREQSLGPFHSAVSAAGWPAAATRGPALRADDIQDAGAFLTWPAQALPRRSPRTFTSGATIVLGDTPYPEPLRDLVAYAHLLARRI